VKHKIGTQERKDYVV